MENEQPSIKRIWEKVRYFLFILFFGFLYGLFFATLLGIFLQLILKINISESSNLHRLLFLFWGIGTIGWHLYLKNKDA